MGISFQLPKYTNRSPRSAENTNKTVCISSIEFEKLFSPKSFFFTLDYGSYRYGWKKTDLLLHPQLPATLAITLESLDSFLSQNPTFIPILLTVDNSDLFLLEKRLHLREKSESEITRRLNLARNELNIISKYIKLTKKKNGKVFYIKDNQTVFDEVIPANTVRTFYIPAGVTAVNFIEQAATAILVLDPASRAIALISIASD